MNLFKSLKLVVVFCASMVSFSTLANDHAISIAKLDDAQVFAEYTDELPAVLNFYTSADKDTVLEFYQTQYGEAIKQERKYDRLVVNYAVSGQAIRLVLSKQDDKTQVDIIVEEGDVIEAETEEVAENPEEEIQP
ncbi:hypothetical protein [Thalassotalea agarivorans]|uniref:Uncharacterized protein n=1 Tax=Thalassotalea agarivorans TaxID=349064 RepID=A0A1I0BYJ8_THASX|nr:hypothetical protein [Thalassotalea agarivorans]SET12192.1 hypothetical protein SAMN05660429_01100 [Thalassotalea agarivorans]